MTELSPEARRLLGLARRGDDPRESDRVRMSHRMAQRLALAAGAAGAALGTTKVAAGTAALSTLLGKGILTGVVVTVTAFGAWQATEFVVSRREPTQSMSVKGHRGPIRSTSRLGDRREPLASATVPAHPLTPTQPAATDVAQVPASSRAPTSAADLEIQANGARAAENTASRAAHLEIQANGARAAENTVLRSARVDSQRLESQRLESQRLDSQRLESQRLDSQQNDPLSSESAALRAVQHAMNAGNATQALHLLDEQDAAYGGGALAPERAAARIVTLCKLARVAEAQRLAQRFEQRFAKSPLLARVRNACTSSLGSNTSTEEDPPR